LKCSCWNSLAVKKVILKLGLYNAEL
jgi:hypothetical protein